MIQTDIVATVREDTPECGCGPLCGGQSGDYAFICGASKRVIVPKPYDYQKEGDFKEDVEGCPACGSRLIGSCTLPYCPNPLSEAVPYA